MIAIRSLRQRTGMTQMDLAKKVGVSQAIISRYENGERSIDLETAATIARALNCTIDDLMKEDAQ